MKERMFRNFKNIHRFFSDERFYDTVLGDVRDDADNLMKEIRDRSVLRDLFSGDFRSYSRKIHEEKYILALKNYICSNYNLLDDVGLFNNYLYAMEENGPYHYVQFHIYYAGSYYSILNNSDMPNIMKSLPHQEVLKKKELRNTPENTEKLEAIYVALEEAVKKEREAIDFIDVSFTK